MPKRIHQNRDEGLSGNPVEVTMADLRALMRKDTQGIESLAVRANLSQSTVINVAYGITERPAERTITAILDALGFRRPIVPKTAKIAEEVKIKPYWPGDILALRAKRRRKGLKK